MWSARPVGGNDGGHVSIDRSDDADSCNEEDDGGDESQHGPRTRLADVQRAAGTHGEVSRPTLAGLAGCSAALPDTPCRLFACELSDEIKHLDESMQISEARLVERTDTAEIDVKRTPRRRFGGTGRRGGVVMT
jgi:hypothetical protein